MIHQSEFNQRSRTINLYMIDRYVLRDLLQGIGLHNSGGWLSKSKIFFLQQNFIYLLRYY